MKSHKYLLIFTALCSFSCISNAIPEFEGKITGLLSGPTYGKTLYIQVDKVNGTYENALASCDNPNWDFIIDFDTDNGKFYSTLILSAYTAGKTVNIQSYDVCDGNVERVRHIWLK